MKRLILLILLAPGFRSWSQAVEPLIFREKLYDFGEIEERNGRADHEFTFTNNSGRTVKILSVQASCGCTTPGWSQDPVPHGKAGFVKASFDPAGRPGYFNKSLTVTTDYDAAPIILQIKGQVVSGDAVASNEFPAGNGSLYFQTRSFNFGTIYMNRPPAQKQFAIINRGTTPVKLIDVVKPSYLKVDMPAVLAPGEKGFIRVTYDARRRNQFGFASDNIQITTDDPESDIKSISVFATLEEYYAAEEPGPAPVLFLSEPNIDLGRFRESILINHSVTVKNEGQRDLQIKALQGNCPCISASADKTALKPGDSTMLTISFKPQSRGGTQQKAITIYSNDPRNPVQRISVLAYIEE